MKSRRNDFFGINVELSRTVRKLVQQYSDAQLEEMLKAYMSLMASEGQEVVEVDANILKQMAAMSSLTISRSLYERSK